MMIVDESKSYATQEQIERIEQRILEVGRTDGAGCLSKTELSRLAGLPNSAVYGICRQTRKVSATELAAIAKELYVSESWLATGSGEKYSAPKVQDPVDIFMRNILSAYDDFVAETGGTGTDLSESLRKMYFQ